MSFSLGDLVHAHGGGLHPDQRDVDQVADRRRRVAVAVDEFIQHVGGVFGGLDGRDALVGFDAAGAVGDVGFGDVGVHPQVHKALALVALDGLALGLCDGLPQHLHVQVVADGLHVAVLAVAQQTARAAICRSRMAMRKPEPKAVNSRMADSRFCAMSERVLSRRKVK